MPWDGEIASGWQTQKSVPLRARPRASIGAIGIDGSLRLPGVFARDCRTRSAGGEGVLCAY